MADDGTTFAPGDGYRQTKRCFEIVERALRELGATFADVVITRMYVTDVSRFEEYARAHGEIFGAHRRRRRWWRSRRWYRLTF